MEGVATATWYYQLFWQFPAKQAQPTASLQGGPKGAASPRGNFGVGDVWVEVPFAFLNDYLNGFVFVHRCSKCLDR